MIQRRAAHAGIKTRIGNHNVLPQSSAEAQAEPMRMSQIRKGAPFCMLEIGTTFGTI